MKYEVNVNHFLDSEPTTYHKRENCFGMYSWSGDIAQYHRLFQKISPNNWSRVYSIWLRSEKGSRDNPKNLLQVPGTRR